MKLFALTSIFALAFSNLIGSQYVGIHGGPDYGFKTDQSNNGQKVGFQIGAIYGHDIGSQFRAEAEVSYRESHKRTVYADKSTDEVMSKKYESKHAWSYMLNVCYDIKQLETYDVIPYIGAGMGFDKSINEFKTKYDAHVVKEKRRDSDFAWCALGGISYELASGYKTRVQYAYHRGQQHTINHSASMVFLKSF